MTNRVTETAERASAYASDKLHSAADQIKSSASSARETASGAYGTARERTAQGIEDGPLTALIGGLALGALAGALLPVSRKESEVLGPLGSKLSDAARQATGAATDAGREALADAGLTRDTARDKVQQLVDSAIQAVTTAGSAAGSAAVQSFKGSAGTTQA